MSDQVFIKHKSNHKQLNERKDKYLKSRSIYRIIIDYNKPRHEGGKLLIEYYNTILVASTHKIYIKSIFLVPHKPYSIILLHFLASTQCY